MKPCKTASRILAAALLILTGAVQAAAAAKPPPGTDYLPDRVQPFLDGLTAPAVTSMEIRVAERYTLPVERADHERAVALLRALELSLPEGPPNPPTGTGPMLGLSVRTAQGGYVFYPVHHEWFRVSNEIGPMGFHCDPESCDALRTFLERYPGVARAQSDGRRAAEREMLRAGNAALFVRADALFGKNAALPGRLNEKNPPALAVNEEEIDTVQIYLNEHVVLVDSPADRARLAGLVNAVDAAPPLPTAVRDRRAEFTLELRMKDGSKHAYSIDPEAANLVADGKKYGDPVIVELFTPVLADIFLQYRPRVAWLGYMNAGRIVAAEVRTGAGTESVTMRAHPQRVREIAAQLKSLEAVCALIYTKDVELEEVRGLSPDRTWTLTFDGEGVVYRVAQYGSLLTMESSDMHTRYLYTLL